MGDVVTIPTLYARVHVCEACPTCEQFGPCACPDEPGDSQPGARS